jgi:hypothetical protein
METTVIIDLHLLDVRIFQVLQEPEFSQVEKVWRLPDDQLAQVVEEEPEFAGITCWADMSPFQFRLLITRALDHLSILDTEDFREDLPLVRQLRFFVAALALRMQDLLGQNVDLMRIQSVGFSKVDFVIEVSQTICLDDDLEDDEPEPPPTGFRVVVDNTRGTAE